MQKTQYMLVGFFFFKKHMFIWYNTIFTATFYPVNKLNIVY